MAVCLKKRSGKTDLTAVSAEDGGARTLMHNERQATKVQLTNRGIKPKEDRHQRIGDNTLIMPKPSSVSDKEELQKTDE